MSLGPKFKNASVWKIPPLLLNSNCSCSLQHQPHPSLISYHMSFLSRMDGTGDFSSNRSQWTLPAFLYRAITSSLINHNRWAGFPLHWGWGGGLLIATCLKWRICMEVSSRVSYTDGKKRCWALLLKGGWQGDLLAGFSSDRAAKFNQETSGNVGSKSENSLEEKKAKINPHTFLGFQERTPVCIE